MVEILRDGIWQFIGAALAAFAFAASVLIYFAQRKTKELAFGVISNGNLLTVTEELQQRVKITFDGNPVPNLQMVIIGLKNSGNVEILASDFDKPFSAHFEEGTKILSVDILNANPTDLPCNISHSEDTFTLEPLLLNPGEWVAVKILATNFNGNVRPIYRVVGVSSVASINKGRRSNPDAAFNIAANAVIYFVLVLVLILLANFSGHGSDIKELLVIFSALFGLLILVHLSNWLLDFFSNAANRYIDT